MIIYNDIEYKQNLFIDLYLPKSDNFDVFIYFHGGGLTNGSRKDAEAFAKTLSKNNIATASVEYRLYPYAKFPDFIKDCAYSIRWLKDNIKNYSLSSLLDTGRMSDQLEILHKLSGVEVLVMVTLAFVIVRDTLCSSSASALNKSQLITSFESKTALLS